MKIIADLHIHSRFSRACSKNINIENLEKYAKIKGLNLLGTGDFTHMKWRKELDEKLKEDEYGILRTQTGFPFLWQTEISLMYTQDGKGRRVHFVILAPNKSVVNQITETLGKKGRLDYDGRPIFGFSGIELVDMMMNISKDIEIIPAHAYTSWFGILGSRSGFDSVEECFKEKSKYIHAIETGISSDPEMNWRLSSLDKYTLVSFSDMHSFWPWRMGREATVFNCDLKYKDIINAIRTKKGLVETIECFPQYGKYHNDGHRSCGVSMSPKESRKLNKLCPVCHKEMTIGVEYRIEELADRPVGFTPKNSIPFKRLLPLAELIASVYNTTPSTKKVSIDLNKLTDKFGSELNVLLDIPEYKLESIVNEKIVNIIMKNRAGSLVVKPGYDGLYGKII
ncbi:MAG: endonuclease Q family protein [Nanoarchaeota archaeon]|nr:endonuclease Q family protein [Nanoarchaeota archaeon]